MSHYLSGLPAWLVQRLSALYMALFTLVSLVWWWWTPDLDYTKWRTLFMHPVVAIATAMFFLALLLHAWVGVRDVILDYAGHRPGLRLLLLAVLGGWLIALAMWVVRIVFSGGVV
jgi:succinate dehydrogenase / fumarate reductase membrane anchor subunit